MEPQVGLLTEIAFGTGARAMLDEPVMACLAGFVGGLRAIVAAHVADDGRTGELLASAGVRELEPLALPMAWRIDRLWTGAVDGPDATDGFALGRAYARARVEVADTGMRSHLRHAAVRSFDDDLYNRGETLRLFGLLARLTRGDLEALNRASEGASISNEMRTRLTSHELVDPGAATDLGQILLALIAPAGLQVPEGWQPPWERGIELST